MGNCCSNGGRWDLQPQVQQLYPIVTPGTNPYQRMDLPLTSYFISSGHNSYLTGNQLNSDSGTSTVVRCLKKGCRVIELDVYNRPSGFSGPVCKHGGTLTSPVSFQACIEAIRDNAFAASPYPVIVTIELHADQDNQQDMANTLQHVLGQALYVPTPSDPGHKYKSPQELMNKVLIRTNASKCCEELKRLVYISNSKFKSLDDAIGNPVATSSSFVEGKVAKFIRKAYEVSGISLEGIPEYETPNTASSLQGAPQAASADDGITRDDSSITPDDIELVADGDGHGSLMELFKYSSRHLMRVYPGGLRIDSSNYNPAEAWTLGASLAALNWQKWDKPLWINEAMFAGNAGCGYVLKPAWMLPASNATGRNPLPQRTPGTLRVHVYGAFCDQGKNVGVLKDDLFIEVEVIGLPEDSCKQRSETASDTDRLELNKYFDFKVRYPEVAVLLLHLKDDDGVSALDDSLAYWAVPLNELVPGDWVVHMTDMKNRLRGDRWAKIKVDWLEGKPPHLGSAPYTPPVVAAKATSGHKGSAARPGAVQMAASAATQSTSPVAPATYAAPPAGYFSAPNGPPPKKPAKLIDEDNKV